MKFIITLIAIMLLSGCATNDCDFDAAEAARSSAMEGESVRIRAQAYIDMCNRNPTSALCNKEVE